MISKKGIAIKFLVLVLLCVFIWGDEEVRCIEREREALLSFKNGLIDEYGILSSWRRGECCKWDGVVCSNTTGNVISLQLDAAYYYGVLGGKVSSSLLELNHLNYLDLRYNDFGGGPIPQFIGSMKQLQHLYLGESNFSGIVPPQLGNLINLRTLDLSYNSLMSENLDWLSSLSLLSHLNLSNFDLSDTNWLQQIPKLHSLQYLYLQSCNIRDLKPSVGLFVNSSSTSLSTLDLSYNYLTSSAFDWLSNISTSLLKIDLSQNELGGQIPNAFERLILLEHLDLSSNMLEGEIPKSLGNLTHLRVLVLYNNSFRGHLDELFANLSAKGILTSLEILDLDHNQLIGPVPDLRAFSALTELYLGSNKFTGSIPPGLGQLSKLEVVDVSHNNLEGTVSESHLLKLDNLKVLDLSFNSLILHIAPDWNPPFQLDVINLPGCKMGPDFPKWIQSQRNFFWLDLSGADIQDEVPKWLWSSSPSLEELILADNQISGTIPDLSSTSIHTIDVSSNQISGPIPLFHPNIHSIQMTRNMFSGSISSICKIPHHGLFFLDLSNNQFAGEVPDCWEKNTPCLNFLNLANNSFSGEIPHSLGSLQNLGALQLRGNNLSGELPSTLKNCQELRLIDVGGNELTGYIPTWIGASYMNLTYLNFRSNKFYGSIPLEICSLTRIRILDMSRNNLSGKIPDCFNNFTSLAAKNTTPVRHVFGYRYGIIYNTQLPHESIVKVNSEFLLVQWKGQELEYRRNLDLLKLIDFSSNGFTGNIPKSFSSMRGLISLNLSGNSLTGNIIPDIGEMEMLECLDLSDNQLSGKIPTSLAQLQYLAVLDLANNNLSGKIPSSTQLQSFNVSPFAGNDGLCGPPLKLCPEDSQRPPTTTTQRDKKEDWFWRLSFMQEFGISMAFGFILGFWVVVGSFLLKRSWRNAYFNFLDDVGDWFYVKITIFLSKLRRS